MLKLPRRTLLRLYRPIIDENDDLCLRGRLNDLIVVNGLKVETADLQVVLDMTLRTASCSRVVCLPSRAPGAAMKQVTVSYIPLEWPPSGEDVALIDRLADACMPVSSSCRLVIFRVGPQKIPVIPMSTLGKISSKKMTDLFLADMFMEEVAYHAHAVGRFKGKTIDYNQQSDLSVEEDLVRNDVATSKGISDPCGIDTDASIFDLGFTSTDMVRLKHRLDKKRLGRQVPLTVINKHSSIRSLCHFS
ncbi:hypothetical protein PG994_000835 [Apiospora phragmitis]|uniref:Carrier domain-containing protein n=1 Tax=Apiospora phragmitis TaxID=2905665 RepID=A0ABR1X7D2_9PEZI